MHFFIPFSGTKKIIVILGLAILYLNAYSQTQRPILMLPIGHQKLPHTIDFSKDGRLVVTGSEDNTFILWDAKTGFIIRRTQTTGPVQQVLFTPDGSQIITLIDQSEANSTQQALFYKWDIKTGKMLMKLPFTASPGIEFLPSGYLLVHNFSDNLNKNSKNTFQNYLDAMKYDDKMTDDEAYEDSLDQVEEKYQEEVTKLIGEPDLSNPKQLAEYSRLMQEKMMQGKGIPISTISVVDTKTFKPVATMTGSGQSKLLKYNNTEYILKEKNPGYLPGDIEARIEIFSISELIKQYQEKKKITAAKEFNTGNKDAIQLLATSPSKGFFANDTSLNVIELWQMEKTTPLAYLKTRGSEVSGIDFSSDGNALYVYSANPPVRFIEGWSTSTFKQILSLQLPAHYIGKNVKLSSNGDYFMADNMLGLTKLSVAGDSLAQFQAQWSMPTDYGFIKDDKEIYVTYNAMSDLYAMMKEMYMMLIDEEEKEQKKKWTDSQKEKMVKDKMSIIPYSQNEAAYKGYTLNWDLVHGGAYYGQEGVISGDYKKSSADKKYLISNEKYEAANTDNMNLISTMVNATPSGKEEEEESEEDKMDKKAAEMLKKYLGPGGTLSKMTSESPNGPVTLLINQKTRDTVSLIKVDSTDWIMLLKNGYYMTSQNGAKSLSYTRGLDVMPFQQFDLKYNRPDKVLQAIGLADASLIGAYKNAWLKRIKKNEIDTTQFRDEYEVPVADFDNRNKIEHDQKTEKLSLTISGTDSKSKLDRFNIWVNEVPVFGKNGKSIKDAKSSKLNTTVEITLSQGTNRIETSVMNANSVESYRVPLFVKYTPDKPVKEVTHFVGIGIDQFADNNNNLQYCTKDIRDLAFALKVKYKDNIIIDTLFNENVTVSNVKALKQKLFQTTENDKVIVSYSGHGMFSKELNYYLSTYSVNFNKPEENGLAYDELENILDSIPARKKLMFIDACHSGEVDKDELEAINKTADSIGLKKDKRGIKPVRNKTVGLNNSFELMQSLFVNVGKSTGATIISAAGGTQFALEQNGNGVLTNSILEAIKQYPTLKISELKKIVGERVEQLTNGLQKPTSRNETIAVDWSIW